MVNKQKKYYIYLALSGILLLSGFYVYNIITHNKTDKLDVQVYPDSESSYVYYANLTTTSVIYPTLNPSGVNLPTSLIIHSGTYTFNGKSYELNNEGLYRFINPLNSNLQRIVYDENGDTDVLLSSLSWIVTHGNLHDSEPMGNLSEIALSSKLYLTRGNFALWAHDILNQHSIKSRLVTSLTLDEWNEYDNGHTLLEVYKENLNKWVVYDIDNNSTFYDNFLQLTFIELVRRIPDDNYEIVYIANDTTLNPSGFKDEETDYNFAFIAEGYMSSIRNWYKRVLQVPMIRDGKIYYHYDLENLDKINEYSRSYDYMDKKQFMEKFYDETI